MRSESTETGAGEEGTLGVYCGPDPDPKEAMTLGSGVVDDELHPQIDGGVRCPHRMRMRHPRRRWLTAVGVLPAHSGGRSSPARMPPPIVGQTWRVQLPRRQVREKEPYLFGYLREDP
jgi:hypothetical protein